MLARGLKVFTLTAVLIASCFAAGSGARADTLVDKRFIASGAGPGGNPHVVVYSPDDPVNGQTPTITASFYAFAEGFRGGVEVALGDLDGDGVLELITAAGPGGGPHVRVFTLNGTPIDKWSFFAYGTNFTGGVHIGVADIDDDGDKEILTGPGVGGGPHLKVWKLTNDKFSVFDETFAYGEAFAGGVTVAGIDLGEGTAGGKHPDSIVTGAGPGGGPHVKLWTSELKGFGGFFAYGADFTGGVSVAGVDVVPGGVDEVATGAMSYAPHLRVLDRDGKPVGINEYVGPEGGPGVTVAGFGVAGVEPPVLASVSGEGSLVVMRGPQSQRNFRPFGSFPGGARSAGGVGKFAVPGDGGPLAITTTSMPQAVKGQSNYSAQLTSTGGNGAKTWSIEIGSQNGLPPGLSLNPSTGVVSGTATAVGRWGFTAVVKDATTPPQTSQKQLEIIVQESAEPVEITSESPLQGTVVNSSDSYNVPLGAKGGVGELTWSVVSGQLPPGTTLTPNPGMIVGKPTQAGLFSFTLRVTDGGSPSRQATKAFTLNIAETNIAITNTELPVAKVGVPYSAQLTFSGGNLPVSCSTNNGPLPAGLSLSAGGAISGTPTVASPPGQPFMPVFSCHDSSWGGSAAVKELALTIQPAS